MERIATVIVDVSPGKPYNEILLKLDMYVDGLYAKDKKYFISYNPAISKTRITDEEARRFLQRMIT
ncbi:hypothetical protein LCGC14_1078630 [marine sediment metagenome]|uniref:Uncharacterized protein n=1 Tax=marine sediment metagenome TaxID=412755 RepID=A0A0F9QLT8_9ZZZZ